MQKQTYLIDNIEIRENKEGQILIIDFNDNFIVLNNEIFHEIMENEGYNLFLYPPESFYAKIINEDGKYLEIRIAYKFTDSTASNVYIDSVVFDTMENPVVD